MATNQKLDRNQIEEMMALTPTQAGMLYHYVAEEKPAAYMQQLILELAGQVDMQQMAAAWQHVANMNEMLRTVYRWDKLDHPVQIVLKQKELPVEQRDLAAYSLEEQAEQITSLRKQHQREGLDIAVNPVRIVVCRLSDHAACMLISWHHLVFDGWSNGILLQEWLSAYAFFYAGEQPVLRVKTPFKTYLRWQQSQDQAPLESYWRRYLLDCEPSPVFPYEADAELVESSGSTADIAKERQDAPGFEVKLKLDGAIAEEIASFTRSQEITPAALYYAAWGLLLHHYTQSDDVVFGTTVSGRPAVVAGIEEMVGMFIATIPLRLQTVGLTSADDCLRSIHRALKERDGMEYAPLVDISRYAGRAGEALFDTIVVLENYPLDMRMQHEGPLRIRSYEMEEATHYALTLGIHLSEGVELVFAYDRERLTEQAVRRIAGHYQHLLLQLVREPHKGLHELELITEEEKMGLLHPDHEATSSSSFGLVQVQFEKQAQLTPDRCAIRTSNSQSTYAELNARANQLARVLREAGVKPDQPVALLLPRSVDWFAAMLGVLKAGGAYIPIDDEYPEERIRHILQDSRAEVLMTVKEAQPIAFDGKVLRVDDDTMLAGISTEDLEPVNKPEDLAYVIYTSGSTGKPKGVMVEHRQLLAYVDAFQAQFQLTSADVVLQQASCSFDHFVEEAYPALLQGAGVMIAERMEVLELDRLQEMIEQYGVTIVTCQPLLLNELNKRSGLEQVRLFISGGDMLKKSHISQLLQRSHVYNSYGPTEATVCASYHCCSEEDPSRVPIGRPIRHYRIYVLDAHNRLMPIGAPGEICIAGAGVARGYYGNDTLTEASFVPDPFHPAERMYRTGDRGKWLSDGRLVFLGRNDDQVKVRGYRVEPGEIEHALAAHPEVEQAVVVPIHDASGEAALAAYVKPANSQANANLRGFLAERLPSYMIPARLYRVEQIPMTAHAKVDKRTLQTMQAEPWGEAMVEGRSASETEEQIRAVWQEVLGAAQVGLNERFFDAGGNSLLLMQLHAKLEKAYAWNVRMADLFTYGTIAEFAQFIDSRKRSFTGSQLRGSLRLPIEFFIHEPWASGEGSLRDTLPAERVHGLRQFAEEHEVDMARVLLGAFAYVLSEVSEEETIVLQSMSEDGESVIPLVLDLSRLSSLRELFAIVTAQYEHGAAASYRFRDACSSAELMTKPEGELQGLVYPAAAMKMKAKDLQVYEFALGYEEEAQQLSISCKFNNRRLNQEKIHALFAVYVDVLHQFSEIRVYS